MTVESKIKSIVEKMEGLTYIFDNWQTANVKLDSAQLPAVINVLPISGKFNLGRQQLKDFPSCMLAFVDKTEFDFNGADNDKIIESCKDRAKEFIIRVNESGEFEDIEGDINYSVIYDRMDVNVTGIVISITLKETKGVNLCSYRKNL